MTNANSNATTCRQVDVLCDSLVGAIIIPLMRQQSKLRWNSRSSVGSSADVGLRLLSCGAELITELLFLEYCCWVARVFVVDTLGYENGIHCIRIGTRTGRRSDISSVDWFIIYRLVNEDSPFVNFVVTARAIDGARILVGLAGVCVVWTVCSRCRYRIHRAVLST